MRRQMAFLWFVAGAGFLTSCHNSVPTHTDTLSSGSIDISVDESYRPVIEEELKVFDSSYPNAKIAVHYKPESECFKDYFDNKAKLILVTRPLSKDDSILCGQNKIAPSSLPLAKDAVAIIVNNTSADTILDMDAIKGILAGVYKKKYTVVVDNGGSSILRYITDSLLGGQKPGANVYGVTGSDSVVDYVKKNPDAIGFVGVSYVSDPNDPDNSGRFINTVKVVAVEGKDNTAFAKPYQAYIALKSYPLVRTLYYINRESYPGLSRGFANFLISNRGQLIFAHAYLFPLRMNIVIRDANINN